MEILEQMVPQGITPVVSGESHAESEFLSGYMLTTPSEGSDCYTCNNCGSGDCGSCCSSSD